MHACMPWPDIEVCKKRLDIVYYTVQKKREKKDYIYAMSKEKRNAFLTHVVSRKK
jgi:hypothetical protein